MVQTYYMTKEGRRKIQVKVDYLRRKTRKLESQMQETAENCGDLWHDNPGLYALIQDTDLAASRVETYDRRLRNFQLVEYPLEVDRVCLGSKVTVKVDGKEDTYDVVGYGDENVDNDKILYNAPIAMAVMGKKPGEKIKAKIGSRKRTIEVLSVDPLKGY